MKSTFVNPLEGFRDGPFYFDPFDQAAAKAKEPVGTIIIRPPAYGGETKEQPLMRGAK